MKICEAILSSEELHHAIKQLTEGQRQAIALRFGGGLSLLETATAMGKTEGAIKALQHSGINALRRLMVREK